MRPLAALCASLFTLAGQAVLQPTAPLPPEILQLARIKQHAMETLARQPNYTCSEVIERSRRERNTRKFQPADTLRLEVALVNGKEMFAWPGSKQFEDKDLRELVPTGAMGTGDFGQHAHTVFGTSVPTFEARSEEMLGDHSALRYDFRVSRLFSGYSIRIGNAQAVVSYHGSFWVEPASLDLVRLDILADEPLPPELQLQSASHRMEYARLPIGAGQFLLPASSEMVLLHSDGSESRNRVQFTSCREYSGQSVIRFDEPAAAEIPASPAVKPEVTLPRGIGVILSLVDEIDTGAAAVGDPVRARLGQDLRLRGQMVMARGAIVSGRISRLERHPRYTVLGLMLLDAESSTAHAKLDLRFERFVAAGPWLWNQGWSADAPPTPHEALIALQNGRVRLVRNLLMLWRS